MARPSVQVVKEAFKGLSADSISIHGAALAYYTAFSIAPLLIIAIAVAGLVFGRTAQGEIYEALEGFVGSDAAKMVETMVVSAAKKPRAGFVAGIVGLATLLLGASGVFSQLQRSLNIIWKVAPRPGVGLWNVLRLRLVSFSMVLVIAFLLLVSMFVNAALSAAGELLSGLLPGDLAFWQAVNFAISFGVVTLLFAAIFKILPDVRLAWRDVWTGATATSFLFSIGKFVIGYYLGKSGASSIYGAAGSFVLLLLWVYYSAEILFFGAEFTRAYATRGGRVVQPKRNAQLMTVHALDPDEVTRDTPASRRR
jgi:membrane protein